MSPSFIKIDAGSYLILFSYQPFQSKTLPKKSLEKLFSRLNKAESDRNSHGPMWIGTYSSENLGQYLAPGHFPPVEKCHCKFEKVLRDQWDVPINKLKKGLMAGAKLDVFFPGFPTLKHIKHVAQLHKSSVRVFEQASRGDNMILSLLDQGRPEVRDVAQALIGSEVWVGWPHLVEAKVRFVVEIISELSSSIYVFSLSLSLSLREIES